ncbi:MAG TPA: aldehyde dehydrogenase [Gammaproteobacteria bacterium]|nr:aldehyde dehydrogenase [Gammaproteobacteria bacterium]
METLANYIDGVLVPPRAGRWLDVYEPATGRVYARAPDSDGADLEAAVAAARRAFPGWSRTSAADRARLLLRLAELVERDLETLARAESLDTGKPLTLARTVDIPRAAANLRFFAAAATQFASEAHPMENGALNYTLRQPLGVVAAISPWNLPLYLFTWKIAPALAAGNCVIGKPSEITPYTAYLFTKLCVEAGLPAGVLNVLHGTGPGIGAAIVAHPEIKAISFTGGTKTGADIAARAAPLFKKLSLELGGKNPSLVFADCDWNQTVEGVARAAFSNQGQICLCGSRVLVERTIHDRFVEALVARARALRIGDPFEPSTEQGALTSDAHLNKVLGAIATARQEGGEILAGGQRVTLAGRCAGGWFVAPTVVTGLSPTCRTNQEEIFGPVVTVMPFDGEDEAVALANGVRYGLAASLWTRDLGRAHRIAERLEAGLVWINCWMLRDLRVPMGGMKDSGVGREGGWEAMRFFTEPKNVTVKY